MSRGNLDKEAPGGDQAAGLGHRSVSPPRRQTAVIISWLRQDIKAGKGEQGADAPNTDFCHLVSQFCIGGELAGSFLVRVKQGIEGSVGSLALVLVFADDLPGGEL